MDLLFQLALEYGKGKLTEAGIAYAMKKLGMGQSNQNPENAISFAGINLNPMNMLKRAGINQGIKSLMGGKMSSLMAPAALLGGAVMLGRAFDPTRQGSQNYNPALKGQIDYLSGMDGMIGRNPSSGLMQYGPNSVLRGKNVVSMFGTNDYAKNLQNYINKMEALKTKGYNTIGFGPFRTKTTNFTDFQQSQLNKAKKELAGIGSGETDIFIDEEVKEKRKNYVAPHHGSVHSSSNGDNKDTSSKADNTTNNTSSQKTSSRPSRHTSGPGGLHSNYRRGGIASLWQR